MLTVGAAIIVHVLSTRSSKIEISILLGIIAVYVMFFVRLGAPERSHLMEYSILAIFIHKALAERAQHRKPKLAPSILALIVAFLIGILDEFIQKTLPNRVFDPQDILFNGFAVIFAIGSSTLLNWIRNRRNN